MLEDLEANGGSTPADEAAAIPPVLRDINLTVRKGELLLIVSAT
jgi:hypothetical protein